MRREGRKEMVLTNILCSVYIVSQVLSLCTMFGLHDRFLEELQTRQKETTVIGSIADIILNYVSYTYFVPACTYDMYMDILCMYMYM